MSKKMKISLNKEVLEFICHFKKIGNIKPSVMEEIFTCGNCYYFSVILKNRFPEGEIYYLPIENHFIFKYNKEFFDITGIIGTNEKPYKWDDFKLEDPLLSKRIERDCIKLETR